ncbi:MAG: hypothetical protein IPM55_22875 [Acidobacteria bacterium]|nr:hypothetical protein [Acidobacteriota bacterium]
MTSLVFPDRAASAGRQNLIQFDRRSGNPGRVRRVVVMERAVFSSDRLGRRSDREDLDPRSLHALLISRQDKEK